MSLTTEEIIGGMYRAHRAGQPFAALVANPQFANLPLETKQEVLAGLRARMGGESTSAVNALTSVIKGAAGGALSAVPLGVVIPAAVELAESGATRKSVLSALKAAANTPKVKTYMGISATIGAAGGIYNTAMNLHRQRADAIRFRKDLDSAQNGGEDLSTVLFGGVSSPSAASHVNMAPVTQAISSMALPGAIAAGKLHHYDEITRDRDGDHSLWTAQRVKEKLVQGYPIDPDRLKKMQEELKQDNEHHDTMKDIVVNSYRTMYVPPADAQGMIEEIEHGIASKDQAQRELSALEQVARRVRDMKRGVE